MFLPFLSLLFSPFSRIPLRVSRTVPFACSAASAFQTSRVSRTYQASSEFVGLHVSFVRRTEPKRRAAASVSKNCISLQEPNSPQSRSLRSPEVSRRAGLTRTMLVARKARPRRRAADARAFCSPSSFRVPRNPRNRRIPRFLSILLASAAPTAQTNPHFESDTGGVHSKLHSPFRVRGLRHVFTFIAP